MKRFIFTRLAERDLDQIKSYLVETAGPAITRRVMKEIRAGLDLLEDLTDKPVKFWPIYSYLVVYDPSTKPVQILRVLHGRRDVADILN